MNQLYFVVGMMTGIFLSFLIFVGYKVVINKRIVEQEMGYYCTKTGELIIDDKIKYILYGEN